MLGLAFGALIYLVCLTGSLVVLRSEFDLWESPEVSTRTAASSGDVGRFVNAILLTERGADRISVRLPADDWPGLTAEVDRSGAPQLLFAARPPDGGIVRVEPFQMSRLLLDLHIYLLLPRAWGIILVGFVGVALLASLVSGIAAHPRIFRDAFRLRRGGGRRLAEADLHNRLGAWGLPFHLIIALTGAVLGLKTAILGVTALAVMQGDSHRAVELFSVPVRAPAAAPASVRVDVERLFAQARRMAPDGRLVRLDIERPGRPEVVYTLTVDRPRDLAVGDTFVFDGAGRELGRREVSTAGPGMLALQALVAHFGAFLGLPVKLAYLAMGLGLSAVTAGGVTIWLERQADRGAPAPGLSALWMAVVWGQPLALAAAVLALSLVHLPGVAQAAWAVVSVLAVGAGVTMQARTVSAAARVSTALVLSAAQLIRLVHFRAGGVHPPTWTVDILLGVLALALAAGVLRGRGGG